MDSKWKVLIGIILAAVFLGTQTVLEVMQVQTYYIGYILAIGSFLGTILIGARQR